jgi:hypothetical protein
MTHGPDATHTIREALAELRTAKRMLEQWETTLPASRRYFAMAHLANAETDLAEYLQDLKRLKDPYRVAS